VVVMVFQLYAVRLIRHFRGPARGVLAESPAREESCHPARRIHDNGATDRHRPAPLPRRYTRVEEFRPPARRGDTGREQAAALRAMAPDVAAPPPGFSAPEDAHPWRLPVARASCRRHT